MLPNELHDISEAEAICFSLFGIACPPFSSLPHIAFPNDFRIAEHISVKTNSKLAVWPHTPRYAATGELDPFDITVDKELPWDEWQNPFNQELALKLCGKSSGAFAAKYGMIVNANLEEAFLAELWPPQQDLRNDFWRLLPKIVDECEWIIAPTIGETVFVLASSERVSSLVSSVKEFARAHGIKTGYVAGEGADVEVHGILRDFLPSTEWLVFAAKWLRSTRQQ